MAKVIFLGSSNAIPHQRGENTHMVFVGEARTVLVDCGSNPILRLEAAGVDFNAITDLIATHFHPDHVSGIPLLLMDMWLLGRKRPLVIRGLAYTLDRLEAMMKLYEWDKWPGFFPVTFVRVPEEELTPVLDSPDFKIVASPVKHLLPTIGLRVEFHSGKVFAYSCDTEPCDAVVRLAAGADVLAHEAGGAGKGHSTALQAAGIAARAEVGRLYLIHYPAEAFRTSDMLADARAHFQGQVAFADDFMTMEF
jgi:ribonuclease Z